jgi:hypothetical protein
MNDQATSKDGDKDGELDLTEILRVLIMQTADPSQMLEWHYWTQEPGVLEFVRVFLTVPAEVRGALQTFLSAAQDPKSVSAFVDGSGTLNLFSPNAAKVMKAFFSEGSAGNNASRLPS